MDELEYFDAETIHNISLATLHDEFATILTTEQLINNFIKWIYLTYEAT